MTLQISKLSKQYKNEWLLNNISFQIDNGEILGIIGDNNASKTSLLRMIEGSEKCQSGQILLDGRDLTTKSKRSRGFNFHRLENHSRIQIFFSNNSDEQKGASILAALKRSRYLALFDDPLNGMKNLQNTFFAEFRNYVKINKLSVIVTVSDDATAFSLCDKIIVLNEGEIVQSGTPREIYETPQWIASAQALGRCNIVKVRRVTFKNQRDLDYFTIEGGHRLGVDKSEKMPLSSVTENTALAIRPEHISISFGASFPGDNLLKAKITEINYQGATTIVKLDSKGLVLEALVMRLVGLNVGDECMVGIPLDRIQILNDCYL